MTTIFSSRKSVFLGLFIWGMLLGSLVATLYALPNEFDLIITLVLAVVWIPTLLVIGAVWFNTRYIIEDKTLIVKIGPYTEREIEAEEIFSIKRSKNIIASPANSLKRIKITYDGGMVLLSPKRESEFISLLQELNPSIKVDV